MYGEIPNQALQEIKYLDDNDGIVDSHEAIGDGNIPWEKLSGWRKQWKHDPSILIEVAGCEKLRKSLQRLKRFKKLMKSTARLLLNSKRVLWSLRFLTSPS